MKLYRRTVLTILARSTGLLPITPSEAAITTFDLRTKPCKAFEAPAMSAYKDTYAGELELNKSFNSFVRNYQLSYEGQDDARVQVGSKYMGPYSDYLDDEQGLPGDEWLPLGPSFQAHVGLFVT